MTPVPITRRYLGAEVVNAERVARYLLENFTEPDGSDLTPQRVAGLVDRHRQLLDSGAQNGSRAYAVGDTIYAHTTRIAWRPYN